MINTSDSLLRAASAAFLLFTFSACKEQDMAANVTDDELPTITEQILANGERVYDIRGNLSPPTFPMRLVVKDAKGQVVSDEVLDAPPSVPGVSQETLDKRLAEVDDYLRELRNTDPEKYNRLAPRLRRLGFDVPGVEQ